MSLDELLTGEVVCDAPGDGCVYFHVGGQVVCLMPVMYEGVPIIGYSVQELVLQ